MLNYTVLIILGWTALIIVYGTTVEYENCDLQCYATKEELNEAARTYKRTTQRKVVETTTVMTTTEPENTETTKPPPTTTKKICPPLTNESTTNETETTGAFDVREFAIDHSECELPQGDVLLGISSGESGELQLSDQKSSEKDGGQQIGREPADNSTINDPSAVVEDTESSVNMTDATGVEDETLEVNATKAPKRRKRSSGGKYCLLDCQMRVLEPLKCYSCHDDSTCQDRRLTEDSTYSLCKPSEACWTIYYETSKANQTTSYYYRRGCFADNADYPVTCAHHQSEYCFGSSQNAICATCCRTDWCNGNALRLQSQNKTARMAQPSFIVTLAYFVWSFRLMFM